MSDSDQPDIEDGGCAFPEPVVVKGNILVKARTAHSDLGMSLRDFIAAQALSGLLSKAHAMDANKEHLVREAYRYADLMIAERKNQPRGSGSRKKFDG